MPRSRRLPLEELAPYLYTTPPPSLEVTAPGMPDPALGLLDWRALFGNDHPVEVEVGFGKGLFLVNAASARPEVNFFGIEIERKYQLFAATRMARRGLGNVRLAQADARAFLRDRIPEASVQAVHVYFPDPWWKKRHHKRRLFNEDFAANCVRILTPGGKLHFVSDVEEYFQLAQAMLAQIPELTPLPPPQPTEGKDDMDYLTNFERKFRIEGRPIHRSLYEKTPHPG